MTTEERLEKLEQEVKETKAGLTAAKHRNRWILGSATLLIMGCLAIAATPGDNRIIRANKFILEDANGKPQAALGGDIKGPILFLLDANGNPRVMIGVDSDGPRLSLNDANGNPNAILDVDKNTTRLKMYNNKIAIATLSAGEFGSGLVLQGINNKGSVTVAIVKKEPMLGVFDANENLIWKAP